MGLEEGGKAGPCFSQGNTFTSRIVSSFKSLGTAFPPCSMDGKQARRTGSSSPLGQLFDHGCDALVLHMMLGNIASTLGMSCGWKMASGCMGVSIIGGCFCHVPVEDRDFLRVMHNA